MKTKNLLFATLMLCSAFTFSQNVGINATGDAPENSAGLDVDFTDKGVLIPRVSLTAINSASPITSPEESLLVYNTATEGSGVNEVTPGYYYWYSNKWVRLLGGAEADGKYWRLDGNSATSLDFIGTTNNEALRFRTDNNNQLQITTSGRIQAFQDGSAAAPTYSFNGGPNNGMYRETATLNWAIGGEERLRLGGSYLRTSFIGTAAAPAYSFLSYTSTGMYAGLNMLRWSVTGGERLRLGTTYLRTTFDGSAVVPAYSFTNNANMGMFRADAGTLAFSTNGAERMRIQADGRTLVNTTSNSIPGTIPNATFRFLVKATGTENAAIAAYHTGTGPGLYVDASATGNDFYAAEIIGNKTDGAGIAAIGGSGADIISTNGASYIEAANTSYAALVVLNSANSISGWYTVSDLRFKKNIKNLDDEESFSVLNKVLQLRPVTYNWRADEYSGLQLPQDATKIGFIAQELNEIFPELVSYKNIRDPKRKFKNGEKIEYEKYYAVNYAELTPILTQAIQEQQHIIDSQKERIEKLEEQVQMLMEKIK